jgi:hypothetical protein
VKPQFLIAIRHYDDRGDPDPPNNARVEIYLGGHTFLYDFRNEPYCSGCVPSERAEAIRRDAWAALGFTEDAVLARSRIGEVDLAKKLVAIRPGTERPHADHGFLLGIWDDEWERTVILPGGHWARDGGSSGVPPRFWCEMPRL